MARHVPILLDRGKARDAPRVLRRVGRFVMSRLFEARAAREVGRYTGPYGLNGVVEAGRELAPAPFSGCFRLFHLVSSKPIPGVGPTKRSVKEREAQSRLILEFNSPSIVGLNLDFLTSIFQILVSSNRYVAIFVLSRSCFIRRDTS